MNREIKFRAWHEKMGMKYNPILLTHNDGKFSQALVIGDGEYDAGYSVSVMQFTGLKDKNGKEIYEGDIIREKNIGHLFDEITTRTVVYGNGGFFAKEGNGSCFLGNINLRYEVVGNIYENPELLK